MRPTLLDILSNHQRVKNGKQITKTKIPKLQTKKKKNKKHCSDILMIYSNA